HPCGGKGETDRRQPPSGHQACGGKGERSRQHRHPRGGKGECEHPPKGPNLYSSLSMDELTRMPPEDRLIVTQHHKLLKARQELTTIQKRVFSLGTAIMRNSDTLLPRIHIPVPYYQRIYGGSTSLYRNLAKNMRDLLDAKVFIEEEPGAMEFVGYPLVSMAAYLGQRSSPTKVATCSFAFNPELAGYLIGLTGHFQSYKLERTRYLSARSDRLFEVLL